MIWFAQDAEEQSSKRRKADAKDGATGKEQQEEAWGYDELPESKPEQGKKGIWQENDEGDRYFNLKANGTRRVTIRKFNDVVGVDIREYYKDKNTGEMKPGRKGIYMTKDQYFSFRSHFKDIDEEIAALEEL